MRHIVARSLRFRWLVVFAAIAILALGFAQIPKTKVDVFPEFAPPQVEIQTIALGNSSNEVEELITVPIEEQLGRHRGPRRRCARSRSRSCPRSGCIFERGTDELRARQLVAERICADHRDAADLGQPAVHDAGAVGDEPDHEDRPHVGRGEPDRPVDHRLLEDPGPAAARAGRGPGRDLGRAAAAAPRAGRPGQARASTTSRCSRSWTPAPTPSTPGLLRYSDGAVVGTGGFVESGGAAAQHPARPAHHGGRGPRPRCRSSSATAGRCGSRTWVGCSSTPARSGATRSSTTVPA